jgi:hypothetical protein
MNEEHPKCKGCPARDLEECMELYSKSKCQKYKEENEDD